MTRYNDNLQPEPLTGNGDYGEWCRNVKTLTVFHSQVKPPVTGEWLQLAATREGPMRFESGHKDVVERKIPVSSSRRLFRAEARDGPEHKSFLRKGNPFNRFLNQPLKQNRMTLHYELNAVKSWLLCVVSHLYRAEMAKSFNSHARILCDEIVSMAGNRTERILQSDISNMYVDDPGMELQSRDGTLFRSITGILPGDRTGILNISGARIRLLDVTGSLARDGTRKMTDGGVRLIRPWCNTTMARDGTAPKTFNCGVKMPRDGTDMPEPHSVVKLPRDIPIGIPFDEIGMLTPFLSGSMHDDETKRTFRCVDKNVFIPDRKMLHAGFPGMEVPVSKTMMLQDGTNFAFEGRIKWILRIGIFKLAAYLKGNHLCTVTHRRSHRLQVLRETYFRWRKSYHERSLFLLLMGEVRPGGKCKTTIRNSVNQLFARLETDMPGFKQVYIIGNRAIGRQVLT